MRATRRLPAVLAASVLALVSGQANAADVEASSPEGASPWRGTAITYEHSFSALSLNKGWDWDYNPYYAQSLALMPMWSFGDQLYLRGNWIIEQELTTSDTYNRAHEIVVSDIFLDLGAKGWTEPETGIRVAGTLRFGLPVSKKSDAEQLYLALAPGLTLTRNFDVLEGLSVGYQGRYMYNFRKYATMQYDGPEINCQAGSDCSPYSESGRRTAEYVISHGPVIQLGVTPKLAVFTTYTHTRARLYALEDIEFTSGTNTKIVLEGGSGYNWRDTEWFGLGASYQLVDSVGVAVGVNTAHPQKQPDSEDYTRFFNRFTSFYVDLNIDVDAVTKLF
jgi:hypothetical protein